MLFLLLNEGHFILIRKIKECIPQRLRGDDILFALQFMEDSNNLTLIFNSWDASASQNLLHLQTFNSGALLPVESATLDSIEKINGVQVSRLGNYPASGIVFEGGSIEEKAKSISQYLR